MSFPVMSCLYNFSDEYNTYDLTQNYTEETNKSHYSIYKRTPLVSEGNKMCIQIAF